MADVDASVVVKPIENGKKAIANFTPPEGGGKELSMDDVLDILDSMGIVAGIRKEAIFNMIDSPRPMSNVVVAEAEEPKQGNEARIETLIEIKERNKAVELEDGSVDFRNLGEINFVAENQALYRRIPPTLGEPGRDIYGNEIPGLPGKDIKLVAGKGTRIDENDPDLVIAGIGGEIFIKDGIMQISPVHEVQGDVDYETGNVKFKGFLKINGTVRSGFEVHAEGDIEIRENVEDAIVEGENDVVIQGGCVGSGNSLIKGGRDVYVKFVENQNIEAGRDIIVSGDSYHANLKAGRSIVAKGGKSTIVGGQCEATVSVEAARFGTVACTPTKIKIGVDPKLSERIKKLDAEVDNAKQSLQKIEKSIVYLYKMKIDSKGKLPPDKAKLLEQLEKAKKGMPNKISNLEKQKITTMNEQRGADKAYAVANVSVFPNVQVMVGNQFITIAEDAGPSRFKMIDGEVVRIPK